MKPQITIREWVERTFEDDSPKVFLELGAHEGEDTLWMSEIPNVLVVAFEPDMRSYPKIPHKPNICKIPIAISDKEGTTSFVLSERGWNQDWTHSSSLRRPKNHLKKFPVEFGQAITVVTSTLDNMNKGIGPFDFIWCDIQGCEGDMIRGAKKTLQQTHYLYMEYSNDEMYEGQPTLDELLRMIPDFRIVKLWPEDVLLENTMWNRSQKAA